MLEKLMNITFFVMAGAVIWLSVALFDANAKLETTHDTISSISQKHEDVEKENETLSGEVKELKKTIEIYEEKISSLEEKLLSLIKNNNEHSNFSIGEKCDIPTIPTHVKFFTDYRAYNLWYTPHYRLQQKSWTDELGCRRYNDDYLVALGSYYSVDIGDRFQVTLDTGETFSVFVADGKWDADCDDRNMYTPCVDYNGVMAGNLLEFIVDDILLSANVIRYGSLDYYDKFKGSVVEMVYLGRDQSGDWTTYETV